jgi:hypothetical protein
MDTKNDYHVTSLELTNGLAGEGFHVLNLPSLLIPFLCIWMDFLFHECARDALILYQFNKQYDLTSSIYCVSKMLYNRGDARR